MYLLDTDTTSNLLDVRRTSTALRERVRTIPLDDLAICVVTLEEMLRGTLDVIRQSQMKKLYLVEAYEEFRVLYAQLYRFTILPFTSEAERVLNAFPASIKRVGVNDCRIAAIAIVHGCTVVTANTQHFNKIPGLTIEDWTQED